MFFKSYDTTSLNQKLNFTKSAHFHFAQLPQNKFHFYIYLSNNGEVLL